MDSIQSNKGKGKEETKGPLIQTPPQQSKNQKMSQKRKDMYSIDPTRDPFMKSLQSDTGVP